MACLTHTIKTPSGEPAEIQRYNRTRAIKAMCSECMGWQGNPKDECVDALCPLFPFRGRFSVANAAAGRTKITTAQNARRLTTNEGDEGAESEA